MNSDEHDTQEQENGDNRPKAKRRSKNTGDDRNYNCGCGKNYLSYPALYTHIKTKHDGVSPAGTSQPQGLNKPGRGRPKKEDPSQKLKEEDEPEDESVDLSDCLENLIQYLNGLSKGIKYSGQSIAGEQNSLTTREFEVDPVQDFPLNLFKDREEDYQPVYDSLKQLHSRREQYEEPMSTQTDLKLTPINRIMAIFILEISQHLRKEFYREFVFFVMMYRKALNNIGWETKANLQQKPPSKENREFCETSNGEYMPEICNDFITDLLPDYLKEYDLVGFGFKVIGHDESKLKNAIFLTMHFCNWLNYHKYTYSRLVLNPDDFA